MEPSLPGLAMRVAGSAMAGSLGDRENLKVGIPKGTPFDAGLGLPGRQYLSMWDYCKLGV